MYSYWDANLLVVLATGFIVALSVLVHYEGLHWLGVRLTASPGIRRRKVLFGVYGVIVLHVAEIWLFGACLWALTRSRMPAPCRARPTPACWRPSIFRRPRSRRSGSATSRRLAPCAS